jgi:hypothetical protein
MYGFKFAPFAQETKNQRKWLNLHKFGMVLENMTFSRDELEKGRCICLFNDILMKTKFSKLVYKILDIQGITFTRFFNEIDNHLPEDFYNCLLTGESLKNKQSLLDCYLNAFIQYGKSSLDVSDEIDSYILKNENINQN